MKKKGRPPGSKNQPTFKLKGTKMETLKLSRECLRIVYGRAHGSGLAPHTVLEDLIMAGDYTMGQAYDNLSNFRKRIREKANERNNVVPITSTEATEVGTNGSSQGGVGGETLGKSLLQEDETVSARSDDAPSERGHRPEDNPAFGSASELGDVVGVVDAGTRAYLAQDDPPYYADEGPVPTDEEGNPIEPQEVHDDQ